MNEVYHQRGVEVGAVKVPDSRLRSFHDPADLAESMSAVGLLHPITVTEGGVLVSGWHRLEAAKSLGWATIRANVVADDDLANRLAEIDENLRRQQLTVYEQSKHAEERERVLEAMGTRAQRGDNQHGAATVAAPKTTFDVAGEAGMSERSWRNRTKIGKGLGEKTRAKLDQADPEEEKHRNFLNSTSQLDHLANISNKRGDDQAAETAERVLNGEFKSTFDAYPDVKGSRNKESNVEPSDLPDLPNPRMTPDEKTYYRIIREWRELRKRDQGEAAAQAKSTKDVEDAIKEADKIIGWFEDYKAALRNRERELEPGNLRRVQ